MAKLRTNQKEQYLKKGETITTKRQAKRKVRDKKHIKNIDKSVKIKAYNDLLTYTQLFLKKTKQQKRFESWLSIQLDTDIVREPFRDRINRYFNSLWAALMGRV